MISIKEKIKELKEDIKETKRLHKTGELRKTLEKEVSSGNKTAFALHYLVYGDKYKYYKEGKQWKMKYIKPKKRLRKRRKSKRR